MSVQGRKRKWPAESRSAGDRKPIGLKKRHVDSAERVAKSTARGTKTGTTKAARPDPAACSSPAEGEGQFGLLTRRLVNNGFRSVIPHVESVPSLLRLLRDRRVSDE